MSKYEEPTNGHVAKAFTTLIPQAGGVDGTEEGRRPIDVEPEPIKPTMTIGRGGTAVWSGYPQEMETDSDLAGRRKYKTFSDLLANVSVVATGVRFFLNLVSKAEWRVEAPEDGGAKAEELAGLVGDIMQDMETPWHRVVRRLAMFKYYGFAVSEWTAKMRDDGVVGMLDVEPRPQRTIERWDIDQNSRVLGAIQRDPQTMRDIYLPREKLVYVIDDSLSDHPEGLGLFRHLVDPGRRLRRFLQLEGYGYENDLRGIPVIKAPLTKFDDLVKNKQISVQKVNSLLEGVTDFMTNHIKSPSLALMLDSATYPEADGGPSSVGQWSVELLDGGNFSLAEMDTAVKRTMLEMARLLGVEHLLMGDGQAGSFALAREKAHNFGLIVDNTLKEIADQLEKDFLGPLWEMNGWDPALKPQFKVESMAHRDLEMISGVLRDMASAGVVLDREDELVQEILGLLGLSRLESLLDRDPQAQLVPAVPREGEVEEMPESPEDRANEAEEEDVE